MDPVRLPADKSEFIGLEGRIHLATGGEPPLLKSHRQAFERFASDKAAGFSGYHAHWNRVEGVRTQMARMVGLHSDEVAFLGNASEGIERVVSGIDWKPGDAVVVSELDYASGRFALGKLKDRGVDVRLVPHDGWMLDEDRLLAKCDERTRLVYVSQVNALTGQHVNVDTLSVALKGTGTVLLVDASHALGAVPVRADLCDFMVSSTYKFLLGTHQGVLTWNRERMPDFRPASVGWWSASEGSRPDEFTLKQDAKRFEYGNVGHLGLYLLEDSLSFLEQFGIGAIADHVRLQSGQMIAGMQTLGLEVMTPDQTERRAANAAFVHSDPGRVVDAAVRDNVLFWGDQGRVRASAHLFTTDADIAAFLNGLPKWLEDSTL